MRRDVISMLPAPQLLRQGLRWRGRLTSAALTTAGGVGIALGASQSSAVGRALVVSFLLVAPTRAILRLLPSIRTADGLIVGVAGAVAVNTLVALSMLSAHMWSPAAGIVTVGLISALIRLVPRAEFPNEDLDRYAHGTADDHLISKGVNT